jgi:hypothetical protein
MTFKKYYLETSYDDDFCKYFKLMYDARENDDFKNAKIFKIYEDLSNTEMS